MTLPTVSAERVTTLLDAVAVLAVAVGVTGGLWTWWQWWSLVAGGALLLFLSAVSVAIQRGPAPKPAPRPDTVHIR